MSTAARTGLTLFLAAWALVLSTGRARALDCPCTWEHVICEADAVAEVEMVLATKTTPDHMVVKRVIWNRTKHRIRPSRGFTYLRYALKPRISLVSALADYRRHQMLDSGLPATELFRRALKRGSYRTIVIARRYADDNSWFAGGVAYIDYVQWLDHPKHAEWWAKVQPFLKEKIEADKRHEKPAFCANVVDVLNGPTQLKM